MSRDQVQPVRTVAVLEPGYASYRTEQAVLSELDVNVATVGAEEAAVPRLQALDPVAIMVRERRVGAAEMAACPNLRVIVRYGVGTDNVDIEFATSRGVAVANVPDYGAEIEVSEHAIALYLAVQRRIVSRDKEVRAGKWGIGQSAMIPGRWGGTAGLVGCGRIGFSAARKFRALGFDRVLAFDPYIDRGVAAAEGIDLAPLDDVCARSDVISLHAPLLNETKHMIGARELGLMKPTAILVNVSRGGLVDEHALADALRQNRLFGAGIDVFENEPVSPDNPLLTAPNTVLSDHAGWYSERSVEVLQRLAAEEVRRVLSGATPKSWVNA